MHGATANGGVQRVFMLILCYTAGEFGPTGTRSNGTTQQLVAVPIPPIIEATVEEVKVVPQEHLSESICGQIVDVPVPQVVEQLVLVPTIMEETCSQIREGTNAIEALQVQVRAISNTIFRDVPLTGMSSAKENALGMQLDKCSRTRFERRGDGMVRSESLSWWWVARLFVFA